MILTVTSVPPWGDTRTVHMYVRTENVFQPQLSAESVTQESNAT